eukprot:TRINITY_DN43613_c0_g1_i1.p1 TRINITY_DN43613_c0_g1~~TRINITY_DN43613_c0_g1_i1.p1  ORF type:complete len:778 (+),score=243.80 TRINITY_DN43613_c0_g1_i1:69-2336(+)
MLPSAMWGGWGGCRQQPLRGTAKVQQQLQRGERTRMEVHTVHALEPQDDGNERKWVQGQLLITNLRVCFTPQEPDREQQTVPVLAVASVQRETDWQHPLPCRVRVQCKDTKSMSLAFPEADGGTAESVRESLSALTGDMELGTGTVEWAQTQFFCFKCVPPGGEVQPGWDLYDPVREFARQGATDSGWRITKVNADQKMCSSYPPLLCVPETANDETIRGAAEYRKRGRFPILSYYHDATRTSLCRAAQPGRGLFGARSEADEKLLRAVAQGKQLELVDLRPPQNAAVNQAAGGGSENPSHYEGATFRFAPIENIHRMRDSFLRMRSVCTAGADDAGGWLVALQRTDWFDRVSSVLEASESCSVSMTRGCNVLIHCSDGWDRTAQVAALLQLQMDPHARTVAGFCSVCEREFVQSGHNFRLRLHSPDQGGPIFLQFLDCVYQLLCQHPTAFEFTGALLLRVADSLYTGVDGTFILNSPSEVIQWDMRRRTSSVWGRLLKDTSLQNTLYKQQDGRLRIDARPRAVRLWREYWLRACPAAHAQETATRSIAMEAGRAVAAANASAEKWREAAELLAARVSALEPEAVLVSARPTGEDMRPTPSQHSAGTVLAAELVAKAAKGGDVQSALWRDRAALMQRVEELQRELSQAHQDVKQAGGSTTRVADALLCSEDTPLSARKSDLYAQRITELSSQPAPAVGLGPPRADAHDAFADIDRAFLDDDDDGLDGPHAAGSDNSEFVHLRPGSLDDTFFSTPS